MLISVIVPCYNEEQVIVETNRQLIATLAALDDLDFEIVYIDDGSSDKTVDLLRAIPEVQTNAREWCGWRVTSAINLP